MRTSFSRRLRSPTLWQVALGCYWLALVIATHLPRKMPVLPTHGIDKPTHLAAFAMLAAVFATTWQLSAGRLTIRHLWWAWILIVLYGALDEWTQTYVGREASFWDWLADVVGAALGIVVFVWARRWLQ